MKRWWAVVALCGAANVAFAQSGGPGSMLFEASMRQQWAGIDEELKLRQVDKAALDAANAWRGGEKAGGPRGGPEGRVVFEFGSTVPRIICAPMRLCDIELQDGEVLQRVLVGDRSGWKFEGAEAGATQHVVVSPLFAELSTNMAIYTDRRVYHLELQSSSKDHMPFVAFAHEDDWESKWLALAAKGQARKAQAEGGGREEGSGDYEISARPGGLDFNYSVSRAGRWRVRRRIDWEPRRVFDDGEKTLIEMPRSVLARELPVLFVRDEGGLDKIVNFRVKGTYFVVDRLFTRAVMVKGVGRRQERIVIERED